MKLTAFNKKRPLPPYSLALLVLMACTLLLFACGGSGGSGGSPAQAAYTGVTSQALITSENSASLIDESFDGAVTSDAMVPFSVEGSSSTGGPSPIPVKLQGAFAQSLAEALGGPGHRSAMASASETMYGSCGGSASYAASYNEQSGVFTGSFSYNNFCEEGVTLSGSATFSGRVDDTSAYFFDYFTFTFTSMTTNVDGQTSTINGSLECDFIDADTMLITADMTVEDSTNGLICWLNNYSVMITDMVTSTEMEISGRYYDQEHGYIDFSTEETLVFYGMDENPSEGLVVFTGAPGTGGLPTKAHLRAISSTYCQVSADFDGDGIMEHGPDDILWTEL